MKPGFVAAIVITCVGLIAFFAVCFSYVGGREVVIRDCDGMLTVRHQPSDRGLHWSGLCKVEHYPLTSQVTFSEHVVSDGVSVKVPGTYIVSMEGTKDRMIAVHGAFGSHDAFLASVDEMVRGIVQAAAKDPSWQKVGGNVVEREAKHSLEYALRRVSPVGVWSSPESRRGLAREIQRRAEEAPFPGNAKVQVDLGLTWER